MKDEFWKEFVRVQFDKLTLLSLLIFLIRSHSPELWTGAVLGSLLTLITANRFRFGGKEKPDGPPLPTLSGPPVDKGW